MLYFDTSFLVPLLVPEDTSERVDAFFSGLAADTELAVSEWTRVEFGSVLSRLVRMEQMSRLNAQKCASHLEKLLEQSFDVITPEKADYDRCWHYLVRFDNSLRAGDALHFAVAANRVAEAVYTLDEGMLSAGLRLGLSVQRGIQR